ncbi:hypothetical protein PsYK624_163530 [Phanerochaete sordida]|uniref:Uncharacterized protein n=1 Tax=Phanerochaete sordida TaxID=48140 RepID=A0A9P3LMW8_9APHY|nr:hypothetical protein PsYK624_163530 [Phanerochaete sordida]
MFFYRYLTNRRPPSIPMTSSQAYVAEGPAKSGKLYHMTTSTWMQPLDAAFIAQRMTARAMRDSNAKQSHSQSQSIHVEWRRA